MFLQYLIIAGAGAGIPKAVLENALRKARASDLPLIRSI